MTDFLERTDDNSTVFFQRRLHLFHIIVAQSFSVSNPESNREVIDGCCLLANGNSNVRIWIFYVSPVISISNTNSTFFEGKHIPGGTVHFFKAYANRESFGLVLCVHSNCFGVNVIRQKLASKVSVRTNSEIVVKAWKSRAGGFPHGGPSTKNLNKDLMKLNLRVFIW